MKKWLLLILISALIVSTLLGFAKKVPVERTETAFTTQAENAGVTKVAILPLKKLDTASDYIRRMLTVRDLRDTFAAHPNFLMQDMKITEAQFKATGLKDVDALDLDDLADIAKDINTDLLLAGNISSRSQTSFTVTMRVYSSKTGEFKQFSFDVVKEKEKRFETLETRFITELDSFVKSEVDKIYNIALTQYSSNNFSEALAGFEQVILFNPEKIEAQYYIGATYSKMKNDAKALENLQKVIDVQPENQDALLLMLDVYRAQNDVNKQIEVMKTLAGLRKDEEIWLAVGNLYAEQANLASAIESFQEALRLNKDFALAQYRLAFLLYDEQRYADALPYLEYAFDLNPDNDLIGRRIAVAYQKTGQLNAAVDKYELVIKNNPSNTSAYLNVVGLYRLIASEATDPKVAAAQYQKAIDAMNKLKTIAPDNALAYLNLATIYLTQNKNKDAETNANLAISKDPTIYQSYVILATISQAKGVDQYNQFVDLEKRASAAVGKQATNLGKQRDAARQSANSLFRNADELLKQARSRTTDQEALNDINSRISRLAPLISQTSGY
ncbi:MAG: tetratricopeptide repeat protein [Candidatus Cloacimonetes bacterium]|nr:tetratricopeptide repeat protein [Candidatus Cloacimonadota bacterium]